MPNIIWTSFIVNNIWHYDRSGWYEGEEVLFVQWRVSPISEHSNHFHTLNIELLSSQVKHTILVVECVSVLEYVRPCWRCLFRALSVISILNNIINKVSLVRAPAPCPVGQEPIRVRVNSRNSIPIQFLLPIHVPCIQFKFQDNPQLN